MGEGSTAARAQVLAAREVLEAELELLEASARDAVDIKAKVRRNPVRTAGVAAGAGFLLVGGPRKVFRGVRRAVMGPPEPLPPSMLPEEIEKALGKLGSDGEKVRGALERDFAAYLAETAKRRGRRPSLGNVFGVLAVSALRPLVLSTSKRLADELTRPDPGRLEERLARIRERRGDDKA